MPLPFGTGELASRVRRALDLRGRIPFMLDEVVVPVQLVHDATTAPFRRSGRTAWNTVNVQGGGATVPVIRIENPTELDQVLEGALLWSSIAASNSSILIGPSSVANTGGGTFFTTTEGTDGAAFNRTPLNFVTSTPAATTITANMLQVVFGTATSESLWVPLDIVIPAGRNIAIEGANFNQLIVANMKLRYYDDVGSLPG